MEEIVGDILKLYDNLPQTGKPRDDEYTVLASFVAIDRTEPTIRKVLSMATGTKCIGREMSNVHGYLMSDSHAEVVARRGLIRFLMSQLGNMIMDDSYTDSEACILEQLNEPNATASIVRIKSKWEICLYVSDSPCGDAAMYEANLSGESKVVTGAKVASVNTGMEATTEAVGCLRTKSGRSDIAAEHRTTSMSCSDKISRWNCLGLQGSLLSLWLYPIVLQSVIVDGDPLAIGDTQCFALHRALVDRCSTPVASLSEDHIKVKTSLKYESCSYSTMESSKPLKTYVLNANKSSAETSGDVVAAIGGLSPTRFAHGKAFMKSKVPSIEKSEEIDCTVLTGKKRRRNPLSPCGFGINWYLGTGDNSLVNQKGSSNSVSMSDSGGAAATTSTKRKLLPISCGGTVEVTIAHTGCLQGTTKKVEGEPAATSRLSRHSIREAFVRLLELSAAFRSKSTLGSRMYAQWQGSLSSARLTPGYSNQEWDKIDYAKDKRSNGNIEKVGEIECQLFLKRMCQVGFRDLKSICGHSYYRDARRNFLEHPLFSGWLCDEDS